MAITKRGKMLAVHRLTRLCRGIVYYSKSHEYLNYSAETKVGRLGLTHFAQDQLGDIVHLDLPEANKALAKGQVLGVVESVKTVADVYSPVSGRVLRVNDLLKKQPELVNTSPEAEGWLADIAVEKPEELADLLGKEAYAQLCEKEKH